MNFLILLFVRFYQFFSQNIQPHVPFLLKSECRYSPTCSEYMLQAVKKHGSWKGLTLGIKRIFRCNPFSNGGYDPVP